MLGFLFASKVNDDAIRLKTHLNLMAVRYLNVPLAEVANLVQRDYGTTLKVAQDSDSEVTVEFGHPDLPDFKFWLEGEKYTKLIAQGRGRYRGFILTVSKDGRHWTVRTSGEDASPDARKLAGILERKFELPPARR